MENKFRKENKSNTIEVMKTPEIVIQEEQGSQLFSLLRKAEDPKWGETETPLAKETMEYFKKNPLSPEILETIKEFNKQDVDEETLYNMALTYQHPERAKMVFELAKKYKPHIKNPQGIYQKFLTIIEVFDKSFSESQLANKFTKAIEQDKNKRIEKIEESKKRIESLIIFFKPDIKTTNIKKVSFIPNDPLQKENSGQAFNVFPGEQIIRSHIDNVLNQDHEFLHGVINRIVDKLSEVLTNEQKDKISQLANNKLKKDYGDDFYSLLCEEFIRTYTEIIYSEEKPKKYEDFKEKINIIKNEQFQKFLIESTSLKERCDELDIKTIEDFKNKSQEYFNKFERNELRDIIFEMYQEYSNRPDKSTNFEQFVLEKLPTAIK